MVMSWLVSLGVVGGLNASFPVRIVNGFSGGEGRSRGEEYLDEGVGSPKAVGVPGFASVVGAADPPLPAPDVGAARGAGGVSVVVL